MYTFASYELLKIKYLKAKQTLNDAIEQKEKIFLATQPQSPNWDKTPSSNSVNKFDSYLISMEKNNVDQHIKNSQEILNERRSLLKLCEQDLYESKELFDKLYRLKFLESKSIGDLTRDLHFSRRQIYRFLETLANEIETVQYFEENFGHSPLPESLAPSASTRNLRKRSSKLLRSS